MINAFLPRRHVTTYRKYSTATATKPLLNSRYRLGVFFPLHQNPLFITSFSPCRGFLGVLTGKRRFRLLQGLFQIMKKEHFITEVEDT